MPEKSPDSRPNAALGLLVIVTIGVGLLALLGAGVAWADGKSGLVPLYLIAAALGFGFTLRSAVS